MKKFDKIISVIILSFFLFLILILISGLNRNKSNYDFDSYKGNVALVKLNGIIIDSEKINSQLEKYQEQKDIKAIVLRINSPGGGVAASQEIFEKVKKVRESGIPVIVSMSSTAASGGYYVALGASQIVANPGTITGSIGVIANFATFKELFDKIGIEYQTIKSGKFKDLGSPFKTFSPEDSARFDEVVQDLYKQFFDAIINERNIEKKDLLKIADGRILTGYQAYEYGLIDKLGTLDDAILLAGELAGIEGKPKVISPKRNKITIFDLLFTDIKEFLSILRPQILLEYILK